MGNIDSLPKWAQAYIRAKDQRITALEQQLRLAVAASDYTRVGLIHPDRPTVYVPDDTKVQFRFQGPQERFLYVQFVQGHIGQLQVNAEDTLVLRLQSSNRLLLYPERQV